MPLLAEHWGILCFFALHDKRSKTQHCIREWQQWFTSHMSCKQRDVDSSHASCVSKRFSRQFDGSYHAISGFRPEVCVCTCLVSPPPPPFHPVAAIFDTLNSYNSCWHSQDLSGLWRNVSASGRSDDGTTQMQGYHCTRTEVASRVVLKQLVDFSKCLNFLMNCYLSHLFKKIVVLAPIMSSFLSQ